MAKGTTTKARRRNKNKKNKNKIQDQQTNGGEPKKKNNSEKRTMQTLGDRRTTTPHVYKQVCITPWRSTSNNKNRANRQTGSGGASGGGPPPQGVWQANIPLVRVPGEATTLGKKFCLHVCGTFPRQAPPGCLHHPPKPQYFPPTSAAREKPYHAT